MRVAFVGKGGSGKSSLSALFGHHLARRGERVVIVDADLNQHVPLLLAPGEQVPVERHLSRSENERAIRTHLLGGNPLVKSVDEFVKTTPPARGSCLVDFADPGDPFVCRYSVPLAGIPCLLVGTHSADSIGTACYHNNLSVLENLLSHSVDRGAWVVVDMVAGIDAFSNSLFAQFDSLVVAVEPSRRGIEVVRQYQELAAAAGVSRSLVVVGNKVRSPEDLAYLRRELGTEAVFDGFPFSPHVERCDRDESGLRSDLLEENACGFLDRLREFVARREAHAGDRLDRLHAVHRKYVAQSYIRDRHGDLSRQIDPEFRYPGFGV